MKQEAWQTRRINTEEEIDKRGKKKDDKKE